MDRRTGRGARPRWGVLGGTFDPPHMGHFSLARAAADELRMSRVLWVPTWCPPHKRPEQLSPFGARAQMTEMTVRREPRFEVSRVEAGLRGASYTVKTLAHLSRVLPDVDLYFVVGADVLPELKDWFEPQRISEWATLACGVRPGYTRPDPDTLPVRGVAYFESPEVDISSSRIRALVRARGSIRGLVAPEVATYIESQGLYLEG